MVARSRAPVNYAVHTRPACRLSTGSPRGEARRRDLPDKVTDDLKAHRLVDISLRQMQEFSANLLELAAAGGPVIALSTTAWRSLGAAQRAILESHAEVIPAAIPTIERIGGGGVRCMLAEIHLPKRAPETPVGRYRI